ncbi:hypothetical protein WMY93_020987 [Mugilogobius chulae]|uniref:Uncharacterized protein n=1 Tax=Mugilogobius chulae TaxID=88201 RepID=A0AAW0NEB2_9GOBI
MTDPPTASSLPAESPSRLLSPQQAAPSQVLHSSSLQPGSPSQLLHSLLSPPARVLHHSSCTASSLLQTGCTITASSSTVFSWLDDRHKRTDRDTLLQGIQLPNKMSAARDYLPEPRVLHPAPVQHRQDIMVFEEPENHEGEAVIRKRRSEKVQHCHNELSSPPSTSWTQENLSPASSSVPSTLSPVIPVPTFYSADWSSCVLCSISCLVVLCPGSVSLLHLLPGRPLFLALCPVLHLCLVVLWSWFESCARCSICCLLCKWPKLCVLLFIASSALFFICTRSKFCALCSLQWSYSCLVKLLQHASQHTSGWVPASIHSTIPNSTTMPYCSTPFIWLVNILTSVSQCLGSEPIRADDLQTYRLTYRQIYRQTYRLTYRQTYRLTYRLTYRSTD